MRGLWVTAATVSLGALLLSGAVAGGVEAVGSGTARSATYTDIPIQETGRIIEVLDGDTFSFVDDATGAESRIRLLGVNTPEVTGRDNSHFDADMCGARPAEALLEGMLPPGTPVQLRSNSKESANKGRFLRYAFALNAETGQYDIDVQALVAASGLAMWFTIDTESALSYPYRLIIEGVQDKGLGIWSPEYCGPVEQPDADLKVTVVWDAPGSDSTNVNGEYVIVRNVGASPVDLSGWLLRDSSLTAWYHFPDGTVLVPGDFRVARAGIGPAGVPTRYDLYMGSAAPLFPNTQDGAFLGDGAYLLDRKTALRAYDEYPCIEDCTDPLKGLIRISKVNAKSTKVSAARRANEEYVVVTNTSASPVLLDGYYLRRKVSTYPFLANTRLQPGGSIRVRIGKGTPTPTTQYWGQASTLLNDAHDQVQLLSNRDVLLSRVRW